MPRVTQTSFTSGEVAPGLMGRIDVTRYYSGAALVENLLVLPQGGVLRRPGTRLIDAFLQDDEGARLIPFAFNADQTYLIVLTGGTMRIYLPDGTRVLEWIGQPWTAAMVREMAYVGSGDTLLLFHRDMQPTRLRRGASHFSWAIDYMPYSNVPTHDFGAGTEPVMSATRGWPACGAFHEQRLVLGGFRSRPVTLLMSKVADYFNFDRGTGLDDEAVYVTLDSDELNDIRQMASARTLVVFTGGSEHALTSDSPVTPAGVAFATNSRRGSKRGVPLTEVDGALLFVQRGGAAVRQFLYSDTEQAYRAELLSLLSPHLIGDPVDQSARKGARLDDADHVVFVRADGQMAVLTTLRAQEIAAFSRWTTQGTATAVTALENGEVFFAVRRNGRTCIEMWDSGLLFDAARTQSFAMPSTTLAGLEHLEGMDVGVSADGTWQGIKRVTNGAVVLTRPATTIQAGLTFTPTLRFLPIEARDPTGSLIGRRSRIRTATARVKDSGAFTFMGHPVNGRVIGAPGDLDAPAPVRSDDVTVHGVRGWAERHQPEITQPVPGPLHVLTAAFDLVLAP